ncbi:hypothetical protein BG004_003064 [Podila humilis]|nr:hypothetical protein BG004_003064 [Podila humilis]
MKGARVLAIGLGDNTVLTTLKLRSCAIGDEGAWALAVALVEKNSSLTVLDLTDNQITNDGAEVLSEMLATNRALIDLNLRGNWIGEYGAQMMFHALWANRSLEVLDLSSNEERYVEARIPKRRLYSLAESLEVNTALTTLTTLCLRALPVFGNDAGALARSLVANTTLAELDLGECGIEFVGILALVVAGRCRSTRIKLLLDGNRLHPFLFQELLDVFDFNSTRATLDLQSCGMEGLHLEYLSIGLTAATNLNTLNVDNNDMGWKGAQAIADALVGGSTFAVLLLGRSNIGDQGAQTLGKALKTNRTLTTLELWSNNIGPAGARALAESLTVNSKLSTLELRGNCIGDDGAKSLAEALKKNTGLIQLDLQSNEIGDAGAMALADALNTNSTLLTLHLDNNNIQDNGAKAFARTLGSNQFSVCILTLEINKIGRSGVEMLERVLTVAFRIVEVSNQVAIN